MLNTQDMKSYQKNIKESLDNVFLRKAMDNFAVAYRDGRKKTFAEIDFDELAGEIAAFKDSASVRLMALYEEFKRNAEAKGIRVHLAGTAEEANQIIAEIGRANKVKRVIKSKSMTAEETHLNSHLEKNGFEVTETDLGEWIIQLRHEKPSHMVMPAIHLSRNQVAELFTGVTRKQQDNEIEKLVKVARKELRTKFIEADMGISGANFAIAQSGTMGLVTNEGNARLVTTVPPVHVALVGLEKLVPTLEDALKIVRILPRNATGQAITSYVTWITGANPCESAPGKRKVMHIVFLDNGRMKMAADPDFAQVLRCVRCGACANVCPVYRMVGGHAFGHIYIGAIGLILTYFFHGGDDAKNLVQNCINCGACKSVCAAGIDLPRLIKVVFTRIQDNTGHPLQAIMLGKILKNRSLFHKMLRIGRFAQRPVTGGTPYLRHLPMVFFPEHNFRQLPAIAARPFRDLWQEIKPVVHNPVCRIALFSGCVQDFVYPEQLAAAVKLLAGKSIAVEFPMDQGCCGLPAEMMGETAAAREVALQNVKAMHADFDYVISLCASCVSHLKHAYPRILADTNVAQEAKALAAKAMSFSQFLHDVAGMTADDFQGEPTPATYHSPCHLCRGLGVREQPHALIRAAGFDFRPAAEEETCCGFGGTYTGKFPTVSSQILEKKLEDAVSTGAGLLVTECPGCIMQLRGGALMQGRDLAVRHLSEVLAERLK
ncbi:MAG: LUD domain-containing protein [Desulfocapsaceae bacterium]|nr:LUD domain-containing protein [Desulfocapsaceae bacterium]